MAIFAGLVWVPKRHLAHVVARYITPVHCIRTWSHHTYSVSVEFIIKQRLKSSDTFSAVVYSVAIQAQADLVQV